MPKATPEVPSLKLHLELAFNSIKLVKWTVINSLWWHFCSCTSICDGTALLRLYLRFWVGVFVCYRYDQCEQMKPGVSCGSWRRRDCSLGDLRKPCCGVYLVTTVLLRARVKVNTTFYQSDVEKSFNDSSFFPPFFTVMHLEFPTKHD